MAIAPELTEVLAAFAWACPSCRGRLDMPGGGDERAEIRCPACSLAFPVVGGIPVMLLDEARRIERR